MIGLFGSVFVLGLVFFASPGPINVETVRRGVGSGVWSAFGVQIGAIIAEVVLGIAVVGGVAPWLQQPSVQLVFTLLSAGMLTWIAWGALRPVPHVAVPVPPQRAAQRSVTVGLITAVSNPLGAMMWLTVAGVAPARGIPDLRFVHIAVIGAGYLLGALLWAVLVATAVGWSRRRVRPHLWRWWNVGSGVLLGGFAVHLVWIAMMPL